MTAEALDYALGGTLADVKAETLSDAQAKVKAEALVDALT